MALEEEFETEIPDEAAEKTDHRSGSYRLHHRQSLIDLMYRRPPLSPDAAFFMPVIFTDRSGQL